jgi:competence protein ComEC
MKNKIWLIIFGIILSITTSGCENKSSSEKVAGEATTAKARVVSLDVGQGDAIFIETEDQKQILIDGGEDETILDKLSKYMPWNDKKIELMVLTHPHADHLNGLNQVLKRYQVDEIWLTGVIDTSSFYLQFLNLLKEKQIPSKIIFACGEKKPTGCTDEVSWSENLKAKVLWPEENLEGKKIDNLNNSSIVLKLDNNGQKILLMGDAEEEVEDELLVSLESKNYLSAEILKVSHHGSSTASSEEFLRAVAPARAIISVGENDYGLPTLRVIRRIERLGIEIQRTDETGDIELK